LPAGQKLDKKLDKSHNHNTNAEPTEPQNTMKLNLKAQ